MVFATNVVIYIPHLNATSFIQGVQGVYFELIHCDLPIGIPVNHITEGGIMAQMIVTHIQGFR